MADGHHAGRAAIDVVTEAGAWLTKMPDVEQIACSAAEKALLTEQNFDAETELCIVLTDDSAVAELNREWRGREGATNVLSFPGQSDLGGLDQPRRVDAAPVLLGDVVIAFETVVREADQSGIATEDHLRHLVVHGVLHLLGFDHERDDEAERMEALEVRILGALGVSDPYADTPRDLRDSPR